MRESNVSLASLASSLATNQVGLDPRIDLDLG